MIFFLNFLTLKNNMIGRYEVNLNDTPYAPYYVPSKPKLMN